MCWEGILQGESSHLLKKWNEHFLVFRSNDLSGIWTGSSSSKRKMFLAVQESSRNNTGSLNKAAGGGFCLLLQIWVSGSLAKSIPILQICTQRKAKARGSRRRAVPLHPLKAIPTLKKWPSPASWICLYNFKASFQWGTELKKILSSVKCDLIPRVPWVHWKEVPRWHIFEH